MLTEKRIRDAKPEAKTRILWDGRTPGFGVRVTPAGAKSYILNYRVAGRERRATLARFSELSLRAARERAGRELAAIRAGESDPLERQRGARNAPTVADGLDRFFGEFAPERVRLGRMTPKTIREYGYAAKRYIRPGLGALKVVERVPAARRTAGRRSCRRTQRNRVLALTSRLFNVCSSGGSGVRSSRTRRGESSGHGRPRGTGHCRPRSWPRSRGRWTSLTSGSPASVAAIRVAAVTGLRIGEVLAIRWEHVDFESGRLTMPQTKTGRRLHDLPAPALAVLADMARINGPWAFTTNGQGPGHLPHGTRQLPVRREAGRAAGRATARPAAHGHDSGGSRGGRHSHPARPARSPVDRDG